MEKELKDFFSTVVNYSLPEDVDKYLESLKNIPETSSYYEYARWLFDGLERNLGRAKSSPPVDGYRRGVCLFKESELIEFKERRSFLIDVVDMIVNGKSLWDLPFGTVKMFFVSANRLQTERFFVPGFVPGDGNTFVHVTDKNFERKDRYWRNEDRELKSIINLASYVLALALLGGKEQEKLRQCENCKNFFLRTRNDKRNRFCSEACRYSFREKKRKTEEGRKKRAEYMIGHRKVLKEREERKERKERREERADRLNRLMASGDTLEEAEKFLNEEAEELLSDVDT